MTVKLNGVRACAALAGLLACAGAHANLVAGDVKIAIPAARFRALHLPIFPDGSMFETPTRKGIAFFAAEGGTRDSADQGTIELGLARPNTSLSDLAPLWTSPSGQPIPSLRPGFLDPPPDENAGGFPAGASFDRDYAGGGPTLYDTSTDMLVQIYHGEYHAAYPSGQPFYTSLGMAVSHDRGRNFTKLGLAIRPKIPPDQPIPPNTDIPTVPSSSGSIVRVGAYFYLYSSDLSPDGNCDGRSSELKNVPCVMVARALARNVFVAASHGVAATWQKYYRGRFSEPGIGGRFSPLVVTSGTTWARWPVVVYNRQANIFLMTDILVEAGTPLKTALEIRESKDGLIWGPAVRIASATAPRELNFPSLFAVDETGVSSPACTTAETFHGTRCARYLVTVVREQNAAELGQPFTRDLLAVDITLTEPPPPIVQSPTR